MGTVVCLFLLWGDVAAAQEQADDDKASEASVVSSSDDDLDIAPPVLEPIAAKPLTPADLPPASPLSRSPVVLRTNVAFSRDWRAGRNVYRAVIEREANAFGLPPALVDSVMAVESGYNPAVVGFDGEIGLMQILPSTARMLGFSGSLGELAQPETNIHYGVKYLAGAWYLAGGDLCTATMKYRAGHGETRFSFLSVEYCTRVRAHLVAQGVPVSGSVPQPTFGRPGGAPSVAGRRSLSKGGSVNFAALNAQLREITGRKGVLDLR